MPTNITFYEDELNIDYLMAEVRFQFGDITGDVFSDTVIRTAIVSAVRYLQRHWNGKYQIYLEQNLIDPQPADVPSGYKRINSLYGTADIPATVVEGSVFRDPYVIFGANSPPLIESVDEQGIILAAVYLLRKMQVTSNVGDFLSWGTEDIRYNNLGAERGYSKLLQQDLEALNNHIRTRIAKPVRSEFPIAQII